MEDVYTVCVNSNYGLLKIGLGNIKCLFCHQREECSHVRYLNRMLLKHEELDLPEVIEKIHCKLFQQQSSAYRLNCFSKRRIPFFLSGNLQNQISKKPDEIFITEDGILKALDVEDDICHHCGSEYTTDYVCQKQSSTSLLLTKYKMIETQCKYNV